MAMTKCRECKKEVSSEAPACPHCGVKNPGRSDGLSATAIGCLAILGFGALVLVIGVLADGTGNESGSRSASPPDTALLHAQGLRNAQVANSILIVTPLSKISALSDGDLRTVLQWADTMSNPIKATAAKHEFNDRRQHQHLLELERDKQRERQRRQEEQRELANRTAQIRQSVASFTFTNGSHCTRATASRVEALVRRHSDWSDDELLKVACGSVFVGMTAEQLRASWGNPQAVNSTTFADGTHEQWVYGDFGPYVYVENGIVTSYQTSGQ